jgi:hypothetical protein
MFLNNIKHICGTVSLLAILCPLSAHAFEVTGKVTNGSSGRADIEAAIEVVNPRDGMQVIQNLRTTTGMFTIENLADTSHVYVIRAVYQGVSYSEIIRYTGSDPSFYEITVYDTTSSLENVQVSIPHLMIRRIQQHLRFELIYEIVNATDPPKTILGRPFKVHIPEDRASVNALYTTELGLPINRDPVPTDSKGIYRVDAPLKPGATRLALSFDVHAHEGVYEYSQVLPYDLESIEILLDDPAIQITSENIALEKSTGAQNGIIYSASSLSKSSILAFRVSGGTPVAAESAPSSPNQGMRIVTLSKATEGGTIPIILILTLFLLALPALSSRKPAADGPQRNMLESRKKRLSSQIAKLDDLYAAGTIAEQSYQVKRAELKTRLAYIIQRTGSLKTKPSRKTGKNKKES